MTNTVPAAMLAFDVATQAELDAVNTSLAAADTALGNRCTTLEALKTTNGAVVATTSGTAKDFTGIPSTAKRVTMLLNNVSVSGTANLLVQVGAGSVVTSGYAGGVSQAGASPAQSAATAGLALSQSSVAASTHVGRVVFELIDPATNTWIGTSTVTRSDGYGEQGGTAIALSGALDRIRLTTSNGTDTFDAGSVNIIYE